MLPSHLYSYIVIRLDYEVEREKDFAKEFREAGFTPQAHRQVLVQVLTLSERLDALPRLHAHKGSPSRDHREQCKLAAWERLFRKGRIRVAALAVALRPRHRGRQDAEESHHTVRAPIVQR